MKKIFLNEFSSYELRQSFNNKQIDSAITIFGSCESHGDHLPLGPDYFVPTEVARQAALRLENTIVVPGVPFGASMRYNANPLAISLRYETVMAIAEDMFESLISYGINHIFVLNGHDDNAPPLDIAMRKIKTRHPQAVFAFIPAWWNLMEARLGGNFFAEKGGTGHGGEGETSITMAVRPDLCELKRAVRQMPEDILRHSRNINIIFDVSELSSTGATGDPTLASAQKGKVMLDELVNLVVETIKELESSDWNYDRRITAIKSHK